LHRPVQSVGCILPAPLHPPTTCNVSHPPVWWKPWCTSWGGGWMSGGREGGRQPPLHSTLHTHRECEKAGVGERGDTSTERVGNDLPCRPRSW
jgi:hypothetical protein